MTNESVLVVPMRLSARLVEKRRWAAGLPSEVLSSSPSRGAHLMFGGGILTTTGQKHGFVII